MEIESQPAYKERTDVENGDENEEAKFAAVERPQSSSPDEIKAGKYVAPGRRKQHNTQAGKLIRPSQINNNSATANSPSAPVGSSPQQNINNKYNTLTSHSMPQQQQTMQKSSSMHNLNYKTNSYYIIKSFPQSNPNLPLLNKQLFIEYNRFELFSKSWLHRWVSCFLFL